MDIVVLFIVKVVCVLFLLGIHWRPLYWKDFFQSRALPDFEDGYVKINGEKYYSPRYKRALCCNLILPIMVIFSMLLLGMCIFLLGLNYLIVIFELFVLYIPLHNLIFPLATIRDDIVGSYVNITLLNNFSKEEFLQYYQIMKEPPIREFLVWCDKYPEEDT